MYIYIHGNKWHNSVNHHKPETEKFSHFKEDLAQSIMIPTKLATSRACPITIILLFHHYTIACLIRKKPAKSPCLHDFGWPTFLLNSAWFRTSANGYGIMGPCQAVTLWLWLTESYWSHGPVEIVDLPSYKMVDLSSSLCGYVYQRVTNIWNKPCYILHVSSHNPRHVSPGHPGLQLAPETEAGRGLRKAPLGESVHLAPVQFGFYMVFIWCLIIWFYMVFIWFNTVSKGFQHSFIWFNHGIILE